MERIVIVDGHDGNYGVYGCDGDDDDVVDGGQT